MTVKRSVTLEGRGRGIAPRRALPRNHSRTSDVLRPGPPLGKLVVREGAPIVLASPIATGKRRVSPGPWRREMLTTPGGPTARRPENKQAYARLNRAGRPVFHRLARSVFRQGGRGRRIAAPFAVPLGRYWGVSNE